MRRPPKAQSLPDVLTQDEIARIILATRERRYQTFWLTTYSLGLRLGETRIPRCLHCAWRSCSKRGVKP